MKHKVFHPFEERSQQEPIVYSMDEYAKLHGLEPAGSFEPGLQLVHIVRNQANNRGLDKAAFRGTQHPCFVVAVQPNRIKVKFGNGIEKVVKHISLYRRKS